MADQEDFDEEFSEFNIGYEAKMQKEKFSKIFGE